MEQHLPMRMSMLGGGPMPPVNSANAISLTDEEYSTNTAARTTGSPNIFIPPSHLLPTDLRTGVETETDIQLPNSHTKNDPLIDAPTSGSIYQKLKTFNCLYCYNCLPLSWIKVRMYYFSDIAINKSEPW